MIRCRVNGGISVISAFGGSYGSAVAVDLPFFTSVDQSGSRYSGNNAVLILLEETDRIFKTGTKYDISIDSSIPMEMGLKSSSALALSVIVPVLKISGKQPEDNLLLRFLAAASIKAGISLTGALDDLVACFYGGLSLCNNRDGDVIMTRKVPEELLAIAYTDRTRKSISMVDSLRSKVDNDGEILSRLVKNGRFKEAMYRNGERFSSATGQDMAAQRFLKTLSDSPVFQSGKGPALATFPGTSVRLDTTVPNGVGLIVTALSNRGLELVEK